MAKLHYESPPIDVRALVRAAVKAGAIYFAVVFAAGFVFGTIRTLWLHPRLGQRAAELAEMPVMLGVIVIAARWVSTSFLAQALPVAGVLAGCLALALVLLGDVTVGVLLRGMSVRQVFADRDVVTGTIYYSMLVLLAAMPWFLNRRRRRNGH